MFQQRRISYSNKITAILGRLLPSIILSLLCYSPSVIADFKDDIGFTALQAQLGGNMPTGKSVPVMHIESAESHFDHDNDPLTPKLPLYLPDNSDTQFSAATITDKSNRASGLYSGHATAVGKYIYGNIKSISPGITTVNAYFTDSWLLYDYLRYAENKPLITQDRVSNSSWISTLGFAEAELLRRTDWVANTDEMVMCVGISNNANPNSSLLSGAFNVIAIGKSDGNNGYGTKHLDGVYVSDRVRPEIVVPLGSSSAATGATSSAVSLLIETAQSNPNLANDPIVTSTLNRYGDTIYNTERSEVIKSVLMAGAERITNNSTSNDITGYRAIVANQTTNGLDIRYGAGQLNIQNSYNIIIAGEQNSAEDTEAGNGSISDMGFDYDPSFGGAGNSNLTANYYFNTNKGSAILSTTLAWNITINGGDGPSFLGTAKFYDLDLTLYDVTSGQALVANSNSIINNTESIWIDLPTNRNYQLQVTAKSGQAQFNWDYSLAWRLGLVSDSDNDGTGDDVDNCTTQSNASQADTDNDGLGDACDSDDDNDGVDDDVDNCPTEADANQIDTDNDGLGDACDSDDDNDSVNDDVDDFPLDPTEKDDTDNDGIGNNADPDDDGDGVLDQFDAFPLDPTTSTQTATDSGGSLSLFVILSLLLWRLVQCFHFTYRTTKASYHLID